MIYRTLEELRNNTLNYGDIVYFCINSRQLKYSVLSEHLSNHNSLNSEIFSILKLNAKEFCDYYYGYHNNGGDWPTCKPGDLAALTRVVKALYQEIESKKEKENTEDFYSKCLTQELKTSLSAILSMPLSTTPSVLEKKENTSSNIVTKRKSKIKRIIGEEPIKLNNY